MRIKQSQLLDIIRAEGGTIIAVGGTKAEVAFADHIVNIPITCGGNKSSRWIDNFRRDVRRRRNTQPKEQR